MKAKEFIPQSKPRNFVAKNQKTAGAGAHKDKKRAEKQGDVKHKNKFNYKQDDWSQDFERRMKEGVAEGSLNESNTMDFVKGLVFEFNKQTSGHEYYPLDYKGPGMRTWTRGDGSRYKDPGYIFIDRSLKPEDEPKWHKAKAVEKFWKFLESKGARKIGDVSGEFGSDPHSPAVVLNKLIFVYNGRNIAWGSTSRLKNSSVWRQKQPGVAEGGVLKSIKRGLQGWQGSSHLDDIQDYIRNASDQTLLRLYKDPGESPYKQTPRDIQIKLINRELKRRYGIKPGEQGVVEGWGDVSFKIGDWTYRAEEDDEGDVRKMYHDAIGPDGKRYDIDFSPYSVMDKETFKMWVKTGMPTRETLGKRGPVEKEDIMKLAQAKGVATLDREMARAGMSERIRDPEDWDEGNTEPPNNFAVYINGKKWKVFRGRGQFADDQYEMQQFRQLQSMAARKSQETGKKWEVYKTGEKATESVEEGWKEKLAAAGLAATIGLGAASGANARVLPGADPSINRFTGEPVAAQQIKKDTEEKRYDFSTEYLKKVADGKHPRPMISVDDAKKELERRGEL